MSDVESQISFIREKMTESKKAQTIWMKKTRLRALVLQTGTVGLSGAVSALLALRGVDSRLEGVFVNLALVAGIGITMFQAWAAFFNDRSMWVSRSILLHQLGQLRTRFEYLVAKNGEKVDPFGLDEIMDELHRIHDEESQRWREIRGWAGMEGLLRPVKSAQQVPDPE